MIEGIAKKIFYVRSKRMDKVWQGLIRNKQSKKICPVIPKMELEKNAGKNFSTKEWISGILYVRRNDNSVVTRGNFSNSN